jgi:hypothetical protein
MGVNFEFLFCLFDYMYRQWGICSNRPGIGGLCTMMVRDRGEPKKKKLLFSGCKVSSNDSEYVVMCFTPIEKRVVFLGALLMPFVMMDALCVILVGISR